MCEQAASGSGHDHMAGYCKLELDLQLYKILEGFNQLIDSVSREEFCVSVLKYIKHLHSIYIFCVHIFVWANIHDGTHSHAHTHTQTFYMECS